MKKLNNIQSREDFLLNEGVVGNFVKKGINAIKNAFSLTAKKIKGIITVFSSNGDVLPVVPFQAIVDHFSNNNKIKVYAPKEVNDDVKIAGGKTCKSIAEEVSEGDYTDDTPDGAKEFFDWYKNGYKKSNYYKNLQTLQKAFEKNESNSFDFIDDDSLNEGRLEPEKSVSYKGSDEGTGVEKIFPITQKEFKKRLDERIKFYCTDGDKGKRTADGYGNLFILGAPGIGKSTIPNALVREFNESQTNDRDKISIISINCALINDGDLLMPAFPIKKDIMSFIKQNGENFDDLIDFENMSEDEEDELKKAFLKSNQTLSPTSPQSWLPVYKETGDKAIDNILDRVANGGKMFGDAVEKEVTRFGKKRKVKEIETYKTGSGGIILLDEFLRANPMIFNQLLNLLLERRIGEWNLGSKWFIVACSNRPCDDERSKEGWAQNGGAARDRWAQIFHMDADPDDWRRWALKKGFDEYLMDFIFDESEDSKINGLYTRWHRVANTDSLEDDSHKPITPRNWMRTMATIVNYFEDNPHYIEYDDGKKELVKSPSIRYMTNSEIKECLGGTMDVDFVDEIIQWIHDKSKEIDVEAIIKDPIHTLPPMFANGGEEVALRSLLKSIEKRGKLTDDEFQKIIIWCGYWFRDYYNRVSSLLLLPIQKMLDKEEKNKITYYVKSLLTIEAAFPEIDEISEMQKSLMEDDVVMKYRILEAPEDADDEEREKYNNEYSDLKLKKAEDYTQTIVEIAKKYFPWRVKNGNLIDMFDESNSIKDNDVTQYDIEQDLEGEKDSKAIVYPHE